MSESSRVFKVAAVVASLLGGCGALMFWAGGMQWGSSGAGLCVGMTLFAIIAFGPLAVAGILDVLDGDQ